MNDEQRTQQYDVHWNRAFVYLPCNYANLSLQFEIGHKEKWKKEWASERTKKRTLR